MKYQDFSAMTMAIEMVKEKKGYHIISNDSGEVQIFSFKTKKEFKKNFTIDEVLSLQPYTEYIPKNILNSRYSSHFWDCVLDGEEYTIPRELVLVIDGVVQN